VTRAVLFDLWDTLVEFDVEASRAVQAQMAERLGRDPDEFQRAWDETRSMRETGPLAPSLTALGIDEALVQELVQIRTAGTRSQLVPRDGAIETLRELGERGILRGLISVCSEEVAAIWEESAFRGLFEVTVFSCVVGLAKPDPRIYLRAISSESSRPRRSSWGTAPTTSWPGPSAWACGRCSSTGRERRPTGRRRWSGPGRA